MVSLAQIRPDFIFESSWEVCNKVGGIYTVLSSRAKLMQSLLKDNVVFIGPDLTANTENPDFIETKSLLKNWQKQFFEKENLSVRIGRWNVPGKPIAVLVDFTPCYKGKSDLYFRMWEKFGVDSMLAYGDYDEACMFAYAAGLVIESLYHHLQLEDKKVIAHLNEWMLGMTALFLKDRVPAIATVFTTHATSIGRSICGNDKPLYGQFENYNGDQMAKELNMEAKHSLEKQTAFHVDCFTTVSRLTAEECLQLLGKNPDIVTPNGFEPDFVPKKKAFEEKRAVARKELIRIAEQLTGEIVSEDALLLATSGRYEYKNKGIDVFVEAVNRVRLSNPKKQIIAFILVPAWIDGPRVDLQVRLRSGDMHTFPLYNPFYTHNLNFPEQDKIGQYLKYLHFVNQPEFKTKLIFVPSYLKGNDGIFNLPYYDLLVGFDLTVFPSYYEPWGYTPLESIAFGIPTITTNLAGFGLWAQEEGATDKDFKTGVAIVNRTDDNYFEVAEELKACIINYSNQNPEQIRQAGIEAKTLSEKASWSNFIQYYLDAYDIALKKKAKRLKKK